MKAKDFVLKKYPDAKCTTEMLMGIFKRKRWFYIIGNTNGLGVMLGMSDKSESNAWVVAKQWILEDANHE